MTFSMPSFISKFLPRAKIFEVYTDGSHKGRWGSWAYVILKNGVVITEASGRVLKTGSTRMELQAAIEALQFLPAGAKANVFSDSRILIDAMTLKMDMWQKQGWLNKSKRPVPNADQIQILQKLCREKKIIWKWIKAHSGLKYNERCDLLCTHARLGTAVDSENSTLS